MRARMIRRHMLGMAMGTFGGIIGSHRTRAADVSPMTTCSWRFVKSRCDGGTTWEQWCYRCCDSTGCTNVRYEWRSAGAC